MAGEKISGDGTGFPPADPGGGKGTAVDPSWENLVLVAADDI
jgi:hypothetical protein